MKKANLQNLLKKTNEAYYWIGFLLADGSVQGNRIKLHLSSKDRDHVSKFAQFIEYSGAVVDSVYAQDSVVVPKLSRYGLVERKTYNPPDLSWMDDKSILCLFAGFVDGDGNIRKLHQRRDFALRIKCHSSWLPVLKLLSDRVSAICGHSLPDPKINAQGYAELNVGNSQALKAIKKKLSNKRLPLLFRKWSQIDLNYVSRVEQATKNREVIKKLKEEGFTQKEIAMKTKLSEALISMVLRGKR